MSTKAGAGLTRVDIERVTLLFETRPDASAALATVAWVVPNGQWWLVDGIFALVTNVDLLSLMQCQVTATYNAQTQWIARINEELQIVPAPARVTFARGYQISTDTGPPEYEHALPEIWNPPGTEITLQLSAGVDVINITQPRLFARAARNEPLSLA